MHNKFSVADILENTLSGKLILKYYTKNNVLHDDQRNLLITTISKYLFESEVKCSISNCFDLEKEICSLFPSEKMVKTSNIVS